MVQVSAKFPKPPRFPPLGAVEGPVLCQADLPGGRRGWLRGPGPPRAQGCPRPPPLASLQGFGVYEAPNLVCMYVCIYIYICVYIVVYV